MTDVVSLRGDPLPDAPERDEAVVKMLETYLERARSGQITRLAIAAIYRDGDAGSAWAGILDNSLIGSVQILQQDLVDTVIRAGRNRVE